MSSMSQRWPLQISLVIGDSTVVGKLVRQKFKCNVDKMVIYSEKCRVITQGSEDGSG